ncbi:MAG: hypothetical protein GWP19_14025 [Planctomycetia bacterium]|nr:hypothetical protein [Planctomycetia bacterium]
MKNKKEDLVSQLTEQIQNTEYLNPQPNTSNIVRTPFKMSEPTLQIFNKLKKYFGLSSKELLDTISEFCTKNDLYNDIVKRVKKSGETGIKEGTVKTMVLRISVKLELDSISNKNKISRDVLLSYLIILFDIRVNMIMDQRKNALKIIEKFDGDINKLTQQVTNQLSKNDSINDVIKFIANINKHLKSAIKVDLDYKELLDGHKVIRKAFTEFNNEYYKTR